MFSCDEHFLRDLDFNENDDRLRIVSKLLAAPESTAGRVKVLVLADLHLQGGVNQQFENRLAAAREWFGWEPGCTEWDALVVAGDLVAGNLIGWQNTEDAVTLGDCHVRLEDIHAKAGARICSSTSKDHALAIPGNHDVVRRGGGEIRRAQMSQMLTAKKLHQSSSFVKHIQAPLADNAPLDAAALCETPKLLLLGGSLGVVAVIGLDSNQLAYKAPGLEYPGYIGSDQLRNVEELVDKLGKVFQDRPLFLWAVWHHHLLPVYNTEQASKLISSAREKDPSPKQLLGIFDAITIDGRTVVEELCKWRVSLATHGHMHSPCIQRVSYTAHTDRILNVLACPSCLAKTDEEHPYVGATLVEIDLERGLAEISINGYERCPDGGIGHKQVEMHETFPIPLVSASRVPLGEMRLFRRLIAWLGKDEPRQDLLGTFPKGLPRLVPIAVSRPESTWESLVPDCLSKTGYVPVCMGTPQDVLKHGMLTREQIATLPKKKYKLLLVLNENGTHGYDILLNNFFPIRTPAYGSWDAPLLPAFKTIHGLVSGWLMDVRRRLDEYRRIERSGGHVADEVIRLEGVLGQLVGMHDGDEELVTISSRQFIKFSPTDGVPTLYEYSLTHWPLLSSGDNADLLRFLRKNDYVRRLGSDRTGRTSFRDYPRGLVWVPLSSWRQSEAIKSRNEDVMGWVEETFVGLRNTSGEVPGWLLLGSGDGLKLGLTQVEQRPFGDGDAGRPVTGSNPGNAPESLVSGLDDVLTGSESCHIYRGQGIRMGRLRLDTECAHGRIGIGVYFVDSEGGEVRAGRLRPVQRYVLSQGLRRAEDLRRSVNALLGGMGGTKGGVADIANLGMTSEAGYLRVTVPGGQVVSVLPLVVERIAVADQEGETAEFVLCDGNHRLVQYLMVDKCESVGCAVVEGEPKQPYYAWPYSRLDWNIVFQNQLEATPDVYSKYTPRYPDRATPSDIKNAPESYRQFFRDFSTGFLDIGTQGGRVV